MTKPHEMPLRQPTILHFHDTPTSEERGLSRRCARAQNFLVEWIEADERASAFMVDGADEIMLLLPEVGATLSTDAGTHVAPGHSVCILPPSRFSIKLAGAGACVVLSSRRKDLQTSSALNQTAYQTPDPRIAPVGHPFAATIPGEVRIFPIDAVQAHPDVPRLKMLQSATLSINWVEYTGSRDRRALSPHSHQDFEQGSLAIVGNFVHHLRVEWGKNAELWRDDVHAIVGSPSLLVVPVQITHTTEGEGEGRHLLIDIYSPPRADFIRNGWVWNAGDYRPTAQHAAETAPT